MTPRTISLDGLTEEQATAIEEQVRYLRELVERKPHAEVRELPRWQGFVIGRLTREEIYEDVPKLGSISSTRLGRTRGIRRNAWRTAAGEPFAGSSTRTVTVVPLGNDTPPWRCTTRPFATPRYLVVANGFFVALRV